MAHQVDLGRLRPERTTVFPGCSRTKRSSQSGPARRSSSHAVGSSRRALKLARRSRWATVSAVERAVDVAAAVDSQNHPLLYKGSVEMTGSERDQSDWLHRRERPRNSS